MRRSKKLTPCTWTRLAPRRSEGVKKSTPTLGRLKRPANSPGNRSLFFVCVALSTAVTRGLRHAMPVVPRTNPRPGVDAGFPSCLHRAEAKRSGIRTACFHSPLHPEFSGRAGRQQDRPSPCAAARRPKPRSSCFHASGACSRHSSPEALGAPKPIPATQPVTTKRTD